MHIRRLDGWSDVTSINDAHGVFLVVIHADKKYYFATENIEVEMTDGTKVLFRDSLLSDMTHTDYVDLYSRNVSSPSFSVQLMADDFPMNDIRKTGILLQKIEADIYWGISGDGLDFSIEQFYHIMHGDCKNMQYSYTTHVVTFNVEEPTLDSGKAFPPATTSADRITNLDDEEYGKPYPVIFGSVKRAPVIDISAGAGTDFLVGADEIGDGLDVTALYIGDAGDTFGAGSTTMDTDNLGTRYAYTTPAAAPGGGNHRNVTVDVDGHVSNTPGYVIRDLIQFYSTVSEKFDFGSVDVIETDWGGVEFALIVNNRDDQGVLSFIRNRILRTIPLAMFYRGERYHFLSLKWHRDVVKDLRYDKNILRKASSVKETDINQIYTNFAASYDRSGYRGDHTGLVEVEYEDNKWCGISYNRLDIVRNFEILDYGDVTNEAGAQILLDWIIELYTKIRIWVSYECTMDAFDVDLLDCVRLYDDEEDWDHGPYFKVVGKTYTSNSTIVLDLVSLDDYIEVYKVNQ